MVPDLPLEETENLRGLATAMGIELVCPSLFFVRFSDASYI